VDADELRRPLRGLRKPVIGSVEVLLANTAFFGITASALAVTSALISRLSNTASMTRSAPARSA